MTATPGTPGVTGPYVAMTALAGPTVTKVDGPTLAV
jgi:hypothetical protein